MADSQSCTPEHKGQKQKKRYGAKHATIIIDPVPATVRAIFLKQKRGGRSVPVSAAEAVAGGLEGDLHTGVSKRRQILLLSGNVLDELKVNPGEISENVIVDGIDVMTLKEGQQLQLGDAQVIVTIPCEPCVQMDRVRPGLQDALQYRRGMFVSVVTPGMVRVGDRVELY